MGLSSVVSTWVGLPLNIWNLGGSSSESPELGSFSNWLLLRSSSIGILLGGRISSWLLYLGEGFQLITLLGEKIPVDLPLTWGESLVDLFGLRGGESSADLFTWGKKFSWSLTWGQVHLISILGVFTWGSNHGYLLFWSLILGWVFIWYSTWVGILLL